MFPLLIAGGLLAGAAYAAWQLVKHMRQSGSAGGSQSQQGDANSTTGGDGADHNPPEELAQHQPFLGADELIDRVVEGVTFSVKRMKVGTKSIGTEEVPSPVPADDLTVRPIRTINEAPRAISSTLSYDDDTFFAMLASKELPVIEHLERRELTEDVFGEARNVLVVLQDVSGSMNDDQRLPWALRLVERLIDRCMREKGEFILILFNDTPYLPMVVRTIEEAETLKAELPQRMRCGGGTDLDAVLMRGMDVLEEQAFGEARIILSTDGTQSIDANETRERLQKLNVFLHTIVIGGHHEQLQRVSNKYDELHKAETPVEA